MLRPSGHRKARSLDMGYIWVLWYNQTRITIVAIVSKDPYHAC